MGRKVGRTVYVQSGAEPDGGDRLVGMFDDRATAAFAVGSMNAMLAERT